MRKIKNIKKTKLKKEYIVLAFIFLIAFSFHLFYSFKTTEFTGGDSYTNLRKIDHINDKFVPIFKDSLNDGSRNHLNLPLFHYLIAFFNIFMPLYIASKLVPALLISSLSIIVYFISKKITNKSNVSLISSFMAVFIPSLISLSLNKVSVYSLFIPLLFFSFYMFMKINEGIKYVIFFIISFILCMITHQLAILLVISLLIYLFIKYIENSEIKNIEIEVIIFISFFILWAYFILYKDLLLSFGPNALWYSIPSYVRSKFFADFDIITAIIHIGVLPFLFGLYVIYSFFFNYKKNYLYVSLPLTTLILLWLKLIHFEAGLSILAISLVILFPHFFMLFLKYFERTKFSKYENYVLILITIIFIFTSVIPSFIYANNNVRDSFTYDEIKAMDWIKENTNENSIILSSEIEGNFISYKTSRKNVLNTNFINLNNAEKRLRDVRTIYSTFFETEAIPLLVKYEIDYILLTDRIKDYYGINDIRYRSSECFELVYSEGVEILRPRCKIEVVKRG